MNYNKSFTQKFVSSLMGKNKEVEDEIAIPHIKDMLEKLIEIPDEKWGIYAFRREPLNGKFTDEERNLLIEKSNLCGSKYADEVRSENGDVSTYKIAENLGIEVEYPQRPLGGGHIIFAQFVEPNKVTVFKDSVDKAVALIEKESLNELFSNINLEEILLAHEIFHFIEEHNGDNMFTKTEMIRLWKIGPLKNDSNIVCLGEIAGMAFAKQLLKLPYSPYILDVFLVYLYNPQVAFALYNEIIGINNNN